MVHMSESPEAGTFAPDKPRLCRLAILTLLLGVGSLAFGCVSGFPALYCWLLARRAIRRSHGQLCGLHLAHVGVGLAAAGSVLLLLPMAIVSVFVYAMYAESVSREQAVKDLDIIARAMHDHTDTFVTFPAPGSTEPSAESQLSWRTRLLHYLPRGRRLAERVKWDEPWDSPNNRLLLNEMPSCYAAPGGRGNPTQTVYLVPVMEQGEVERRGASTIFRRRAADLRRPFAEGTSFREILDGTSNTVLCVEASQRRAVVWIEPRDLDFDPDHPRHGLGSERLGGFLVVMADGAVRIVSHQVNDESVRQMFLMNDLAPIDVRNSPLAPRQKVPKK